MNSVWGVAGLFSTDLFLQVVGKSRNGERRLMIELHLTFTVKTCPRTVTSPLGLLPRNRNPSMVGFNYYLKAIQ